MLVNIVGVEMPDADVDADANAEQITNVLKSVLVTCHGDDDRCIFVIIVVVVAAFVAVFRFSWSTRMKASLSDVVCRLSLRTRQGLDADLLSVVEMLR